MVVTGLVAGVCPVPALFFVVFEAAGLLGFIVTPVAPPSESFGIRAVNCLVSVLFVAIGRLVIFVERLFSLTVLFGFITTPDAVDAVLLVTIGSIRAVAIKLFGDVCAVPVLPGAAGELLATVEAVATGLLEGAESCFIATPVVVAAGDFLTIGGLLAGFCSASVLFVTSGLLTPAGLAFIVTPGVGEIDSFVTTGGIRAVNIQLLEGVRAVPVLFIIAGTPVATVDVLFIPTKLGFIATLGAAATEPFVTAGPILAGLL